MRWSPAHLVRGHKLAVRAASPCGLALLIVHSRSIACMRLGWEFALKRPRLACGTPRDASRLQAYHRLTDGAAAAGRVGYGSGGFCFRSSIARPALRRGSGARVPSIASRAGHAQQARQGTDLLLSGSDPPLYFFWWWYNQGLLCVHVYMIACQKTKKREYSSIVSVVLRLNIGSIYQETTCAYRLFF